MSIIPASHAEGPTLGKVQTHYWQGPLLSHPQPVLTHVTGQHLETQSSS